MKLLTSILVAAVCADESSPTLTSLLDELQAYCVEAYTVPAPRTKPRETRSQWTARWTARNRVQNLFPRFCGRVVLKQDSSDVAEPCTDVKSNAIESKKFTIK